MHNGAEVSEYIHNKAYKQLNVDVERNGEILSFTVVPVSKLSDNGEEGGLIGVQYRNKPYPKEFIKFNSNILAEKINDISLLVIDSVQKNNYKFYSKK